MAKNNISITLCIPTYNRANYLPETLESIFNQTYSNFELLVINDGSTDGTDGLMKKYKDKRLKYLKNHKNLGYIKTMNKGTQMARGDWIMHVSDDDKLRPTMLEEMVKALEMNVKEDIGFVVPQSANINETGKLISEPPRQLSNKNYILLNPKEFIFNFTLYGRKIRDKYQFNTSFPSTLFNKKILMDLGMSSEEVPVSHDILIESKICLKHKVLVLDKALFEYRVHENWGSSLNRKGTFLNEYQVFMKHLLAFVKVKDIKFNFDFQRYLDQSFINYLFSYNGGLLRLSAKYNGGYNERIKKIAEYTKFCITKDRSLFLSLNFYAVLLASLLPQIGLIKIGQLLRKA